MQISIANGFFLPVPPVAGGSTEKSWYELGREFGRRGHRVVSLSRRWPGFAAEEIVEGVHYVRLPGAAHHRKLWRNLLRDLVWSLRISRALPAADVVVCNTLAAPMWLGTLRPAVGAVTVMSGRMPKGQYRRYGSVARVYSVSGAVEQAILRENPRLQARIRRVGYPIPWRELARPRTTRSDVPTIGYIGRLHVEKGLELLANALRELSRSYAGPWRAVFVGPADVAQGGSGSLEVNRILGSLARELPGRIEIRPPVFDSAGLIDVYRQLDLFCYPSLAERGETFGVSVAEAMAAGAVPVVSALACFEDFVEDGKNGVSFNHRSPDAHRRLAARLRDLLQHDTLRRELASRAQRAVEKYDVGALADVFLADFAELVRLRNSR